MPPDTCGLAAEVGLATRASAGSASRRLGLAAACATTCPAATCCTRRASSTRPRHPRVTALAPLGRADRLRVDRELAGELPGLTWAQAGKRARAVALRARSRGRGAGAHGPHPHRHPARLPTSARNGVTA